MPWGQTVLGVLGMLVWGGLCGVPALAIYSLTNRPRSGAGVWVLLVLLLIVWLPLVTGLCLWAMSRLMDWPVLG